MTTNYCRKIPSNNFLRFSSRSPRVSIYREPCNFQFDVYTYIFIKRIHLSSNAALQINFRGRAREFMAHFLRVGSSNGGYSFVGISIFIVHPCEFVHTLLYFEIQSTGKYPCPVISSAYALILNINFNEEHFESPSREISISKYLRKLPRHALCSGAENCNNRTRMREKGTRPEIFMKTDNSAWGRSDCSLPSSLRTCERASHNCITIGETDSEARIFKIANPRGHRTRALSVVGKTNGRGQR